MEALLHSLGQCGRFQVRHVFLVQLCRFFASWGYSLMIFGLYNPGWHCYDNGTSYIPQSASYQSDGTASPLAINKDPASINAVTYSQSKDTSNNPLIRNFQNGTHDGFINKEQNVRIAYNGTCDVIESCAHIEFNPSSSTIVAEFDLVCDKVWIGYSIVSVLNFGMLLGSLLWGQVGERFGRKTCLYASTLGMTLSCGLAIFSPVWQVYATFTFFIGFSFVGMLTSVSVLCMEFLSSEWRGRVTSIPIWNFGIISFALVTYILRDWRQINLASVFVGIIALLGLLWTPESLRWLVLHGKTSEAEKVVRKVSKANNIPITQETLNLLTQNKTNEERERNYSYRDLFRNRETTILIIKLSIVRIVSLTVTDIIGYGIQSLPGDFYLNIVIASLIEIPFTLLVGLLATRFGRRITIILFISNGVICCTSIVIALLTLDEGNVRDLLVTSFALINRSAMSALVDLLFLYNAELSPTAIRNLSLGFLETSGRITAIVETFLIPRDYTSLVVAFSTLMVGQVVAVIIVGTLPETRNKPLRESLRLKIKEGSTSDCE